MIPRPITRSPGTRVSRADTRQRQLESLAAEFALLAQRRARVVHQLDLLDQQREAAATGFARLQSRLTWLMEQMDAIDPELRPTLEAQRPPEPEPPPPPRLTRTVVAQAKRPDHSHPPAAPERPASRGAAITWRR
jgi:chromosome segregation ATPase